MSVWSLELALVHITGDRLFLFRAIRSQPPFIHPLCQEDCVWSRRDEKLGRMEIALFRPATLTLAYGMPSVMTRAAEPLESHSRTLDYLEVLHYFTFLPSPHAIFFSSHSQVKLIRVPAPAHIYPGPVPLFLSFANQDVK